MSRTWKDSPYWVSVKKQAKTRNKDLNKKSPVLQIVATREEKLLTKSTVNPRVEIIDNAYQMDTLNTMLRNFDTTNPAKNELIEDYMFDSEFDALSLSYQAPIHSWYDELMGTKPKKIDAHISKINDIKVYPKRFNHEKQPTHNKSLNATESHTTITSQINVIEQVDAMKAYFAKINEDNYKTVDGYVINIAETNPEQTFRYNHRFNNPYKDALSLIKHLHEGKTELYMSSFVDTNNICNIDSQVLTRIITNVVKTCSKDNKPLNLSNIAPILHLGCDDSLYILIDENLLITFETWLTRIKTAEVKSDRTNTELLSRVMKIRMRVARINKNAPLTILNPVTRGERLSILKSIENHKRYEYPKADLLKDSGSHFLKDRKYPDHKKTSLTVYLKDQEKIYRSGMIEEV